MTQMLNLASVSDYKSLSNIQCIVSDLTILTGLNGSGKTQLLSAIEEGSIQVTDSNGILLQNIIYMPLQSLIPNDSAVANNPRSYINTDDLWLFFQNHFGRYIMMKSMGNDVTFSNSVNINSIPQQQRAVAIKNMRIIDDIIARSKKEVQHLIKDDFSNYKYLKIETDNIFQMNLALLFKSYQVIHENNEYMKFRNKNSDTSIKFLNEEEFNTAYGEAPWVLLNKIISTAKLDYTVNSPGDSDRDSGFELKLINSISGIEIKFSELSSGEQVLMSLVLAMYNSNYEIIFPDILLLDEPDAFLHPSMSKQFIDVINNVFVKGQNVKVFITTHSPSTVALAPADSIFIVNKVGATNRIEKASKDKALRLLTSGVPSFSVNYENRRQVFVESPYDVEYYEILYNIFNDKLNPEISLSFISSGDSRTDKNGVKIANCSQVIAITNLLREKGNNFVWGIIDWDLTNSESDYVKVLGNKSRYNIESYIFDPVLIAALLWKRAFMSAEELGLPKGERYVTILALKQHDIQNIANFVIDKLSIKLDKAKGVLIKSRLVNGFDIEIPSWFLEYPGHDLEKAIVSAFPVLNQIKKDKEKLLKLAILNEIASELVELVPIDLLLILKAVQEI